MQTRKLHFGPLKQDKPFLTVRQTMKSADEFFYRGYDPLFLAKKSNALYGIYKNSDAFWASAESWNLVLASGKDELLNVIATELHSARFHQTEALIALLLCEFQNRPDWVYLTTYGNAEMKGAAKAIASGEFSALTKGMVSTAEQFIKAAVFANWDLSGTDAAELWTKSIQDIAWLIGYAAERFTKANEYNAYKHGLRVAHGPAGLRASVSSSPATLTPLISMKHAVTYLELSEQEAGYIGSLVTKEISPQYSFELIQCLASVLLLTKDMRLARATGTIDSLNILEIDREGLIRIEPASSFSFPY
jgi:hypothetical protein